MIERYETSISGVQNGSASPPPSIQSKYQDAELTKYVDSLPCHDEPGSDDEVRLI